MSEHEYSNHCSRKVAMVYVPYPAGPGTAVTRVIETARLQSDGSWNVSTTSDTRTVQYKNATKSNTNRGKKILIAGKYWWQPVKPYARTATLAMFGGTPAIYGSSNGRIRKTLSGGPTVRVTNPYTMLEPFNGTGGKFTSNISSARPTLTQNTRDRLIAECMRKVGDRKANYGETIGEGRKTINHLAQTSSRVVRAILALRRGNFRRFADALRVSRGKGWVSKDLASRWLEYQYAWMPLLNDIYDTSKVLSDGLSRNAPIISSTRMISESGSYNGRLLNGTTLTGNFSVSHRCKLWYRMSNADIDRLSQLGLINPVEVVWALVPFSFVVDWFMPVGTLLEAYSSTMGLSFVDGVISSRGEIFCDGEDMRGLTDTPNFIEGSRPYWAVGFVSFERHKVASATPGLYFKSPFSTKHVISAFALIRALAR